MYENYLLNPSAIAAVMNQIKTFRLEPIAPEEIKTWLDEHRWQPSYFLRLESLPDRSNEVWLQDVHGAKLLHDLFLEFSNGLFYYDKVICGFQITSWLVDNFTKDLNEIKDILSKVLNIQAEGDLIDN